MNKAEKRVIKCAREVINIWRDGYLIKPKEVVVNGKFIVEMTRLQRALDLADESRGMLKMPNAPMWDK